MSDSAHRFHVPPERALLTPADASGALSALFALDSRIERHLDWLLRATEEVGQGPMRSDAGDEGCARAGQRADRNGARAAPRACRARGRCRAGAAGRSQLDLDIVAELVHPPLPETFGPFELLAVEASFVNGMTLSLRTAADSLQALRDRLADVDDDESRGLAQRIKAFPQVVTT